MFYSQILFTTTEMQWFFYAYPDGIMLLNSEHFFTLWLYTFSVHRTKGMLQWLSMLLMLCHVPFTKHLLKPLQPFSNQRFVEETYVVWVLNCVDNGYRHNSADEFVNILRRISDAFCNLMPIVQFKKCEKHTLGSASAYFSPFLNCTNGMKLRKASHLC